jgi:hypothetical protein
MYYLRRIVPEKWDNKVSLDAVSVSDLSTGDNDISVWQINDMNELEEAGLTIAMTKNILKDVNVVIMEDKRLIELGLKILDQPGKSHYAEKNDSHKNISVPTFWEIGYLTEYIHNQLQDEKNFHYFAEDELKETLYKVAKDGSMNYQFMADKDSSRLRGTLIAICCEKKDSELRMELEKMALKK